RLRSALAGVAALAVVVAGAVLAEGGGGDDVVPPAAPSSSAPARPGPSSRAPADGLPTVTPAELPAEARRTLALLDAGGPFPYARDGVVFGNREGLLPRQRSGCYREYTVRTPGEGDRGARRIVTSCAGPRYWSDDHYESFSRITGARL
ncbi:MAG: guanine-specific ribonuclease, partial [Frankiales bacterium]|nr:guanine-specific ribonuclease [Frankiales bacterium]